MNFVRRPPEPEESSSPQKPRTIRDMLLAIILLFVIGAAGAGIYILLAPKFGFPYPHEIVTLANEMGLAIGKKPAAGELVVPAPADQAAVQVGTNLEVSGTPYVNRVENSVCGDPIQSRVVWRDESIAFVTRDACKDVSVRSISPQTFGAAAADKSVIVLNEKLFENESIKTERALLYCFGTDASSRKIEVVINQNLETQVMFARLLMTTDKVTENVDTAINRVNPNAKLYTYSTTARKEESPPQPFLSLTVTNLNGWTGFLAYSLEFKPKAAAQSGVTAWRNDQLNLTNCYWP